MTKTTPKTAFTDTSVPAVPSLVYDLDTLASSLGLTQAGNENTPSPTPNPDMFVQALVTTHNKLVALKDLLTQQAQAQREQEASLSSLRAELEAEIKKYRALNLLSGSLIAFEQKPMEKKRGWFTRN